MAVRVEYQPPAVNPVAKVAAVSHLVAPEGAEALLQASKPFVPVDTGELLESGAVTIEGSDALVSYHRTAEDGFNVAVWVHEDMTAHHPNGGQAHYLSTPMHTAGPEILAAMVKTAKARL